MILNQYTQAAVDIARKAGEYILSREQGPINVHEKLSSFDYVTDVDTSTEAIIREALLAKFPHHGFAGEEQDRDEDEMKHELTHMGEDEYCWVVDPLDGTVNFIHGLGGYGVSIGLLKNSEPICGAIYLPTRDEMFYAQKGDGAYLNGQPIHVSQCGRIGDALIAGSIPATNMEYRSEVVNAFPQLAMHCFNLRMVGSATAAICYVASGRLDGYIELGHHPWDVAAGMLLITEAGGTVTNHRGEPFTVADPKLVASNGKIQDTLLSYVKLNPANQ